jgi:hypothetical protein
MMFVFVWGDNVLWSLGSKVFFDRLMSAMDNIIDGKKQTKMQLHFVHNRQLSLILNGLGIRFRKKVALASTLFFELHLNRGKYYVRTLYNDHSLTFGDCTNELCEYETFKHQITNIHPQGDIQDLCNADSLGDFKIDTSKFVEFHDGVSTTTRYWLLLYTIL